MSTILWLNNEYTNTPSSRFGGHGDTNKPQLYHLTVPPHSFDIDLVIQDLVIKLSVAESDGG